MATATVSGSVDANVKQLVSMHLKRKGLTANEVIKSVWNHIANTGEIPFADDDAQRSDGHSAEFSRIVALRETVPSGTLLDVMDKAALRKELAGRDE